MSLARKKRRTALNSWDEVKRSWMNFGKDLMVFASLQLAWVIVWRALRHDRREPSRRRLIDISGPRSKSVDEFAGQEFDYVITVCDNANQQCPMFPGKTTRSHWSIEDPAAAGNEEEHLNVFRRVRDELRDKLREFVATDGR